MSDINDLLKELTEILGDKKGANGDKFASQIESATAAVEEMEARKEHYKKFKVGTLIKRVKRGCNDYRYKFPDDKENQSAIIVSMDGGEDGNVYCFDNAGNASNATILVMLDKKESRLYGVDLYHYEVLANGNTGGNGGGGGSGKKAKAKDDSKAKDKVFVFDGRDGSSFEKGLACVYNEDWDNSASNG